MVCFQGMAISVVSEEAVLNFGLWATQRDFSVLSGHVWQVSFDFLFAEPPRKRRYRPHIMRGDVSRAQFHGLQEGFKGRLAYNLP